MCGAYSRHSLAEPVCSYCVVKTHRQGMSAKCPLQYAHNLEDNYYNYYGHD